VIGAFIPDVYPGSVPRPDSPPLTRGVVLRGVGIVLAVALGGLAVWLIVTSRTQKHLEIGVLAGLWGALLGAFAMFGSRRFRHPLDDVDEPLPSTALALRATDHELERAEEAAARRAHEARLEHMLRREIRTAVTAEVAALRDEIAALRSELLEKVGGQLRLERIETTRVIGSDLEALQHEVRQLKAAAAQEADLGMPRTRVPDTGVRQIVEPARVRPSETTGPIRTGTAPAAGPSPSPAPRPQPAAAEPIVLPLQPSAPPAGDEFAGLPRIRPFTDFELDPAESVDEDDSAYTGRRRRGEEFDAESGRHASEADGPGRRHRRGEDNGDDLLARLLAREGIHR
jgi:hypothetical protein